MPLRYLTPFAFLALLPLGGWLGGAWTFMAAAASPLCLVGLDEALGEEPSGTGPSSGTGPRWLPRLYIALQLVTTTWAAAWVARTSTSLLEATGLTVSAGLTTGVFGFVAAHEMIHSPDKRDRAIGLTLLGSVFYMHFRISHVFGHHLRAATSDDPASARLGESLYAFIARSMAGQLREAWTFERDRLRRAGRTPAGPGNRVLIYLAIEASLLMGIAAFSLRALAFAVATAIVAIALLEAFNYVAHYGLTRRMEVDGRAERLGPPHSWNSGRRMNNAALFNMGRHSDHHRVMTRPYEQLEPLTAESELPSGYASALLTALVPPLWRKIMDPRARAVMNRLTRR